MDLTKAEEEELRRLEESLLRPEVRSSRKAVEALLDETFVEIGASGRVYDKRQTLAAVSRDAGAEIALSDFSARLLVPGVAQVMYRSVQAQLDGNKRETLRSSIWMKRGERWKIVFHQGTLV